MVNYIAFAAGITIYFIWHITNAFLRRRALARLGKAAPKLVHWLPFGIDTIVGLLNANSARKNYEYFDANFKKYGPTYQFQFPGAIQMMTCDPDNIKAVNATKFDDFGKGPEFHASWEYFLGDGLVNVDGEQWQRGRNFLRPQFQKQKLVDLQFIEKHTEKLVNILRSKAGETVDMKDYWFRFTMDVCTDFLFGESVDALNNPEGVITETFDSVQKIQATRARLGPLYKFYHPKAFTEGMNRFNKFIEPYVNLGLKLSQIPFNEKDEKNEKAANFIESLSVITQDRKVIRDQVVSIMLAGRDPPAATLCFLFYELGRHPEVVKALRAEILEHLGVDMVPTYMHLKDMRYMQHVINETLRLYPPAPYNLRQALTDTSIPHGGGPNGTDPIAVPKGASVWWSAMHMQRRRDLFGEDADEFKPERWNDNWHPMPWQFIPFHGGPRICPGQNLAMTEISFVTARILQIFESIESRDEEGPMQFETDLVLTPFNGTKLAFK